MDMYSNSNKFGSNILNKDINKILNNMKANKEINKASLECNSDETLDENETCKQSSIFLEKNKEKSEDFSNLKYNLTGNCKMFIERDEFINDSRTKRKFPVYYDKNYRINSLLNVPHKNNNNNSLNSISSGIFNKNSNSSNHLKESLNCQTANNNNNYNNSQNRIWYSESKKECFKKLNFNKAEELLSSVSKNLVNDYQGKDLKNIFSSTIAEGPNSLISSNSNSQKISEPNSQMIVSQQNSANADDRENINCSLFNNFNASQFNNNNNNDNNNNDNNNNSQIMSSQQSLLSAFNKAKITVNNNNLSLTAGKRKVILEEAEDIRMDDDNTSNAIYNTYNEKKKKSKSKNDNLQSDKDVKEQKTIKFKVNIDEIFKDPEYKVTFPYFKDNLFSNKDELLLKLKNKDCDLESTASKIKTSYINNMTELEKGMKQFENDQNSISYFKQHHSNYSNNDKDN